MNEKKEQISWILVLIYLAFISTWDLKTNYVLKQEEKKKQEFLQIKKFNIALFIVKVHFEHWYNVI